MHFLEFAILNNVMFCELPKSSNVFCTEMMSEENFMVCLDLSIISTFSGLTSDKISTECEAIITCLNLFFTIFTKLLCRSGCI